MSEKQKIAALLDAIEAAKGVTFIRNDEEYPAWAARQWIERKYVKYGAGIQTADEFIKRTASRSETTGRPYLIRLPDGRTTESAYWLRPRLAEIEARSRPTP